MQNELSLDMILTLTSSRSRGLSDNLSALALTLLLYDSARRKGLLPVSHGVRSVPRALALARQLDWDTQRQCLDKGHEQGERYGFFCRLENERVKPGNRREWMARPFPEAWDDFEWIGGQPGAAIEGCQPLVVGDGVKLRNVIDFRALLLRILFDRQAQADKKIGKRVWRISVRELETTLGASEFATQTALNRAGLRKIGRTVPGFVMK